MLSRSFGVAFPFGVFHFPYSFSDKVKTLNGLTLKFPESRSEPPVNVSVLFAIFEVRLT